MKYLIVILMLLNCSYHPTEPIPEVFIIDHDSMYMHVEYDGDDSYWPRPKYRLWECWSGSAFYKYNDNTLIAFGDTIIAPHITGWITPEGDKSSNWDENESYDGIRADGMPYFLDSMFVISTEKISRQPLVYAEYVNHAPNWFPAIFPSYVKWREKNRSWQNIWGFWPEVPDENGYIFRLDSAEYKYNINDTVMTRPAHPSYFIKYLHIHKEDILRVRPQSKEYLDCYLSDSLDWGGLEGIVRDRRISELNSKMRYYLVEDTYYGSKRWYTMDELYKKFYIPD